MSVAFEGPPELGPAAPGREPLPAGHHDARPRAAGERLRAVRAETPRRSSGASAPGEAESVVDALVERSARSCSRWSATAPGATTSSTTARPSSPRPAVVKYHTNGFSCPRPEPERLRPGTRPQTLVWQGTRPVTVNLQGNLVEAYPPRGAAEVRPVGRRRLRGGPRRRERSTGRAEHFRALGTNVWRRERLADSEIRLRPLSPGTACRRERPRTSATAATRRP